MGALSLESAVRSMFRLVLFAIALVIAIGPRNGWAATLIRDPDIEHALKVLATPVLQAAGLSPSRVGIYVIGDPSLNAFVLDPTAIYIHSGMILRLTKASELQSVIAHEAAHIANGHLVRRAANAQSARNVMLLGTALSVAAGASGAGGAAASGIALGVASSAQRVFFGHTRAEESAADQSGMRYLAAAGIETAGAVSVMELFAGQEALPARRQDIYARSHPLSRDRLRTIKALAQSYRGPGKADPVAEYWFDRAKGKISAFQRNPKWTFQRAKESPAADVRAMREAVAYHRLNQTSKALASLDRARQARPGDPYYDELRGQILLETRNFQAAASAYGAALQRAPKDPLIMAGYGRSLVALGGTAQLQKAVPLLERSTAQDWRNSQALRDLGAAYAKLGQAGMAALVTAEAHAMHGRTKDARVLATRAAGLLPRGSVGWQRAQDVLNAVRQDQ